MKKLILILALYVSACASTVDPDAPGFRADASAALETRAADMSLLVPGDLSNKECRKNGHILMGAEEVIPRNDSGLDAFSRQVMRLCSSYFKGL